MRTVCVPRAEHGANCTREPVHCPTLPPRPQHMTLAPPTALPCAPALYDPPAPRSHAGESYDLEQERQRAGRGTDRRRRRRCRRRRILQRGWACRGRRRRLWEGQSRLARAILEVSIMPGSSLPPNIAPPSLPRSLRAPRPRPPHSIPLNCHRCSSHIGTGEIRRIYR